MAAVSIVTPVYNGESHLRGCIESILQQTYQDWEYTIVNNCSQDATLDIALEYARRDHRVRVVNNTRFVGCEENHNIAFQHVDPHADWVKVVQADDLLRPQCIERFVSVGEADRRIVLVGANRMDMEQLDLLGLPASRSVFPGREIGRSILLSELPDVFGSPTSHMFRARAVRAQQPFYNESNVHADTEACFCVLKSGDFGFAHEVLTFTRRAPGTETSRSKYLRTRYPGWLMILANHGKDFLSEDEFNLCLQRHLESYYMVLARDLLRLRRGPEYWRYHIATLREAGYPLEPVRLLRAFPAAFRAKYQKRRSAEGTTNHDAKASKL